MSVSQNEKSDNVSMDYWNTARIKTLSTNSEWMNEVYSDAMTLVELASAKGTSDSLRLNYTNRAIDALEEVREFLKSIKE